MIIKKITWLSPTTKKNQQDKLLGIKKRKAHYALNSLKSHIQLLKWATQAIFTFANRLIIMFTTFNKILLNEVPKGNCDMYHSCFHGTNIAVNWNTACLLRKPSHVASCMKQQTVWVPSELYVLY